MTAGRRQLVRMIARLYAILVLLFGFFELTFGVFLLAMGSHAAPLGIVYVVPGFILAALGAVLWLGAYWAAPLAFAVSLVPRVFPLLWHELAAGGTLMTTWLDILGLATPTAFLVLTVLLLASVLRARTSSDGLRLPGPTASRILAAVVLSYGLCLVLLGALELTARGGPIESLGHVPLGYFLAWPGAALLALVPFIWRDRIWAMVAAFAASLVPWIYPLFWMEDAAGAVTLDWFNLTLLVVPTLFGVLAAYAVLSTLRRGG